MRNLFVQLAVGDRLLAACVCPSWRAALDDAALWTELDFSGEERFDVGMLNAAVRKAAGALTSLTLPRRLADGKTGGHARDAAVLRPALLRALEANASSLTALSVRCDDATSEACEASLLEEIARLCPRLVRFEADLNCAPRDALPLLTGEVSRALRLRRLVLTGGDMVGAAVRTAASHASLSELYFESSNGHGLASPEAVRGVADAALAGRWALVSIEDCGLGEGAAPHLSRLLGPPFALATLSISRDPAPKWAGAPPDAAPPLCAALRCCALSTLRLTRAALWARPALGVALVSAVARHPTLRTLDLRWNFVHADSRAIVGATLATLVAPRPAALTSLDVSDCNLGAVGIGPLVAAVLGVAGGAGPLAADPLAAGGGGGGRGGAAPPPRREGHHQYLHHYRREGHHQHLPHYRSHALRTPPQNLIDIPGMPDGGNGGGGEEGGGGGGEEGGGSGGSGGGGGGGDGGGGGSGGAWDEGGGGGSASGGGASATAMDTGGSGGGGASSVADAMQAGARSAADAPFTLTLLRCGEYPPVPELEEAEALVARRGEGGVSFWRARVASRAAHIEAAAQRKAIASAARASEAGAQRARDGAQREGREAAARARAAAAGGGDGDPRRRWAQREAMAGHPLGGGGGGA